VEVSASRRVTRTGESESKRSSESGQVDQSIGTGTGTSIVVCATFTFTAPACPVSHLCNMAKAKIAGGDQAETCRNKEQGQAKN